MKSYTGIAHASHRKTTLRHLFKAVLFVLLYLIPFTSPAQAISGIITDYNGFWKTASASPSSIKPDNSHNLLAFTYNGVQYSTGVNDELLSARGENFVVGDFWALPVDTITGVPNSNTKAGFGALYDGTLNGGSAVPPDYGITPYLTDGIKGMNLGTCIANLPSGTMTFVITNIHPASIGDGIPDILVTQIADPSGAYDRYDFTDVNGVRVGGYKDIIFTNISPVASWTADFYEARVNPLSLLAGFTQTDRPVRLWAADLSEFGVTAANYSQIRNFRINLSGQSDVAFVAYNNKSVNFQNPLPVHYGYFRGTLTDRSVKLSWQTLSEQNADRFVVERSGNATAYEAIATVMAKNGDRVNEYSFTDPSPLPGKNYYRLQQFDSDGSFSHTTTIVRINNYRNGAIGLQVYPNPASEHILIEHPAATGREEITLYNASGMVLKQLRPATGTTVTKFELGEIGRGAYWVQLRDGTGTSSARFLVN